MGKSSGRFWPEALTEARAAFWEWADRGSKDAWVLELGASPGMGPADDPSALRPVKTVSRCGPVRGGWLYCGQPRHGGEPEGAVEGKADAPPPRRFPSPIPARGGLRWEPTAAGPYHDEAGPRDGHWFQDQFQRRQNHQRQQHRTFSCRAIAAKLGDRATGDLAL